MTDRYARQELFRPIGREGQAKLGRSHVLIVGAGALGSASAEIMVRSGVGTLSIVDRDYVEWSNLPRQSLYEEADALERMPKAAAAAEKLRRINSNVDVRPYLTDLTPSTLERLLSGGVDLIIDATDNFDTRLFINDAAYRHGIPWIFGACAGGYGLQYTFLPGETSCLNCVLGSLPTGTASCDSVGIIAPAVHMVVSWQTTAALKILTGNRQALTRDLVVFDVWAGRQQAIRVGENRRRADCPTCGHRPMYPYLHASALMKAEVLCGRDTVMIRASARGALPLERLEEHATKLGRSFFRNPYLVSIDEPNVRLVFFKDGRALVHGTSDPVEAKKLYHRYMG